MVDMGLKNRSTSTRTWLGRGSVALLVASGCEEPRDDETNSGPVSITLGNSAGGSETGSIDDDDVDGASSSDGTPKLDVGSAPTTGQDPDGEGPNLCEQDIDIVFVMDVSTSMGPFLDTLATELFTVDQALAELDLPSPPHYGLVVFVDDIALLGAGAPYADAAALRADFEQWSDFTSSNQQVGGGNSNSTWPENSLDALHAAASGFQWRPVDSTLRIVIHTTDDTFWEGPSTQNGVSIEHGYAQTVQALQDQQIRVFSFTAEVGGSCECDDVTAGWQAPYQGNPPIPQATDGGQFDIDGVLAGQLSLSEAINESVEGAVCDPYEPVG